MLSSASGGAVVDELARRREQDRERKRRQRARAVAPDVVRAAQPALRSPSPPLVLHTTKRLESIGSTPEAYSRVPPHVDAPPRPPDPAAQQAAQAGAAKVALIVAGMFRLALSDAVVRYELEQRLAAEGVSVEDANTYLKAAVGHVFNATQRACVKHGLGFSLPYEDELTAIGAALGSGLYLAAKFTGRLPRPGTEQPAAEAPPSSPTNGHRREPPPEPTHDDPYAPIKMDAA